MSLVTSKEPGYEGGSSTESWDPIPSLEDHLVSDRWIVFGCLQALEFCDTKCVIHVVHSIAV